MKKPLLLITWLLWFILIPESWGQVLIPNSSVTGICYAGKKVNRIYIPPPKEFMERAGTKGGGTIKVTYTGFTPSAQAALGFAVSIWESLLPPDTRISVKASWAKISDAGVLANSSITGYAAGWGINALDPEAYYPVTVAEKIAGRSINEDFEADVELTVNNTISWYLGTDGNTPTNKYDLVTVTLHELCHGLGFFDSMDATNSVGSYGFGSVPLIYDTFVENLLEKRLTDTLEFSQNSTALYNALVGGQLYFAGPLTKKHLSGGRARLYAPSTFDPGSSVSHLDELRTPAVDALMTPFIDLGEAIHNPGNLTYSMLGDVGWINTRIIPVQLKDTEAHITSLEVGASIKSDTVYNKNNVGLVYSFDGFNTSDSLIMVATSTDNSFSRTISIPGYNVKLEYYMYAVDDFSRIYKSPSRASREPYTLFIGIDTVKPVISHIPNEYYFEKIDSILFNATVTDNLGIDTVYVEYNINNGSSKYFGLTLLSDDDYSRNFNVRPEDLKGGDVLNYRIVAIDKAAGRNTRFSPSGGFYSVKIEGLETVQRSYSTDFTDAAADFFNSGFSITKPAGFTSNSLNSEHPYKSPEQDNATLNFSSVLRHPIIFDPSGIVVSFRELVLVEPGAEGSVFGFSDFYDYVIVEGSVNYGKSWFGLTDGYDSRLVPSWETAYNSSIVGQNSTFVGLESMMLTHTMYPRLSGIINPEDTILVRFRLFSDPYAYGWGWVIDDLKITPLVDKVDNVIVKDLTIYPNPGNGLATIISKDDVSFKPLRMAVYNSTGQCIINRRLSPDNEIKLDLSGYPSGIYLILIDTGSEIKTLKYNLMK